MMQFVWLSSVLLAAQSGAAPPSKGEEPRTLDCPAPPSREEILRALPPLEYGVSDFYQVSRDEIEIVPEKLVDRLDSPRFFPFVGWAQLHHIHWKCTIFFVEKRMISFPFQIQMRINRTEVVYIDKDQLHLSGEPQPSKNSAAGAVVGGLLGACVGSVVGADEERREPRHNQMSTADVIQLTQRNVSDDIILQQIHATHSVFQLSTADIESLQSYGVSSRVIEYMQSRRPRTIVGQTTGTIISNGLRNPVTGPERERTSEACRQSTPVRQRLTLEDVVRMTREGESEEAILRQIETSHVDFSLGVQDAVYLLVRGVSSDVIRAMVAHQAESQR